MSFVLRSDLEKKKLYYAVVAVILTDGLKSVVNFNYTATAAG